MLDAVYFQRTRTKKNIQFNYYRSMTAFDKFCPIDGFSSKYLWQDLKVHVFNSRRPKFQNEFTVHFTVHYMGWRYPSHASTLRPHELAQCV